MMKNRGFWVLMLLIILHSLSVSAFYLNTGASMNFEGKTIKLIDVSENSIVIEVDGQSMILTKGVTKTVKDLEIDIVQTYSRTERSESAADISINGQIESTEVIHVLDEPPAIMEMESELAPETSEPASTASESEVLSLNVGQTKTIYGRSVKLKSVTVDRAVVIVDGASAPIPIGSSKKIKGLTMLFKSLRYSFASETPSGANFLIIETEGVIKEEVAGEKAIGGESAEVVSEETKDIIPEEQKDISKEPEESLFDKIDSRIYWTVGIFVVIVLGLLLFYFLYYKKREKVSPKKLETPFTAPAPTPATKKVVKEIVPATVRDALIVNNLSYSRGKKEILSNINFKIRKGDMVSIIGGSGVGKSSLIECLVHRVKPSSGEILIFEKDIYKNPGIFKNVGFVPQSHEIYMDQTVMQNMINSATKWGVQDAGVKIESVLKKVKLAKRKNVVAKNLSGGQKKLLSLAMELIHDPELLILDEPTTGLDPKTRNDIVVILSTLTTRDKKTVLLSTHFMDDAEECDEVIILGEEGIILQRSPSKLKKSLPGSGRVVNIMLDNVTKDLIEKIMSLEGIDRVIREGRSLRIIAEKPSAVRFAGQIEQLGGIVNKTEIVQATIKEVFIYYTGEIPEE